MFELIKNIFKRRVDCANKIEIRPSGLTIMQALNKLLEYPELNAAIWHRAYSFPNHYYYVLSINTHGHRLEIPYIYWDKDFIIDLIDIKNNIDCFDDPLRGPLYSEETINNIITWAKKGMT